MSGPLTSKCLRTSPCCGTHSERPADHSALADLHPDGMIVTSRDRRAGTWIVSNGLLVMQGATAMPIRHLSELNPYDNNRLKPPGGAGKEKSTRAVDRDGPMIRGQNGALREHPFVQAQQDEGHAAPVSKKL